LCVRTANVASDELPKEALVYDVEADEYYWPSPCEQPVQLVTPLVPLT
jgi:hypothetical protein